MATKLNYNLGSKGPTNTNDAKVAASLGSEETAQVKATQNGRSSRQRARQNTLAEVSFNKTVAKNVRQIETTARVRETRKGHALVAGWIATPVAVAALGGVGGAAWLSHDANEAAAATAAAQASASAEQAKIDAGKIDITTGDRNMCNMVVISTDKAGNKTVLNLGQGNPNDPHMTGDAIAKLIEDGKATGANVTVGDTNEGTAIITLDSKGKIVSKVIPESCKQDAGQVFDSPKA